MNIYWEFAHQFDSTAIAAHQQHPSSSS